MEIFQAIANQDLVKVQALIKADPNVVNRPSPPDDAPLLLTLSPPLLPGITPLMATAQYCVPQIAPTDDQKTKDQKTHQARAVIAAVIQGVLAAKANINEIDVYKSRTALHWAVANTNHLVLEELLVTQGVKDHPELHCHQQDVDGMTAAELAKKMGNFSILKQLNEFRLKRAGKGPVSMAIVGMGATGTALFIRLVRELLDRGTFSPAQLKAFTFHLIDSKHTPGCGMAYSTELNAPTSILNVVARGMSIDSKDGGDFLKYVEGLRDTGLLEKELGEAGQLRLTNTREPDPLGYYPRVFFGSYSNRRLDLWIDRATKAGINVVVHRETLVTDVSKPGDEILSLRLQEALPDGKAGKDMAPLQATHIFYATGHWDHKKKEPRPYEAASGTIFYPASRETLTARGVFAKPNNIAVMGSSLSAIDAVFAILLNPAVGTLTWDEQGVATYAPKDPKNPFKVTCYSRRGAWPKVRPASTPELPIRNWTSQPAYEEIRKYHNLGDNPTLDQCIEMLDREMAVAYNRPPQGVPPAPGDKGPLPSVMQMFDPIKLMKPGEKRDPFALLEADAKVAEVGDSSSSPSRTWVRWYAVLNGVLGTMKRMYRNFTAEERARFDRDLNTPFLWAFAPMPLVTAKVLLALHRAGVLTLHRTAIEFPTVSKDGKHIEWQYFDENAKLDGTDKPLTASHEFMAVVAGLGSDMRQDASELTINQFNTGEFTCIDPKVPGATENTIFLHEDDSYEFVTTTGTHSASRRGVGFFAHGSVWSIQAVPMVVMHSGRAALIYADEFEHRLAGSKL